MARPPRRPGAPGSAPRSAPDDDHSPATGTGREGGTEAGSSRRTPAAVPPPVTTGAAPGAARAARSPRRPAAERAPRTPRGSRPAAGGRPPGTPRPPRRGAKATAQAGAAAAQSHASAWLAGLRGSGFTLMIMALLVLAVVVLAPGIRTFVEQRAQIAELQRSVDAAKADAASLDTQTSRWADPAYIRAQARERLYFVMPGEVGYLVIDDAAIVPEEEAPVSDSLQPTDSDWVASMLSSIAVSGLGEPGVDQLGSAE